MAFHFVYWIVLLSAGVLEARSTGNQRILAGTPNGIIPKTDFACRGRGAGYYADVQTDCQVYHLCDGQGRQYSYTCPNATLFQQRMLICDHWYMVDCSASEANYAFNRLIGQKDQPFVSESDAGLRTPRPDILDRPYAPDYKGESFRKEIDKSNFPALQNAISGLDLSKNNNRKYEILETQASSNILPPQFDTNSLDPTLLPASEEFPQPDKSNERRNAASGESEEVRSRNFFPPPTKFEPPRVLPSHNQQFRRSEEERLKNLGLPLQTPTQATRLATTTRKPVRTFDPDKNFKAFNHFFPSKKATHKDYDFSQYFTRKNQVAPTAPSAARRQDFNTRLGNNNQLPVGPPATQRPSAFNKFNTQTTTTTRRTTLSTTRAPVTQRPVTTTTRKAPTVTRSQVHTTPSPKNRQQPAINQLQRASVSVPSTELQPPINVVKVYDDATTKGPPIYYEWKVPDGELQPPRFDNETDTLLNSLKRSITEEGNYGTAGKNDFQSSESRRTVGHGNKIKIQYKDLQRHFAIPQVEFPLESAGREGYEKDDAVNSFQVRIPYRAGSKDRYYYLEHSHCNPECHPYFFKPGRCEPCIKIK